MASERDDLNARLRRRRQEGEQRRRTQAKQRRQTLLRLGTAAAVLILAAVLIFWVAARNPGAQETENTALRQETDAQTDTSADTQQPSTQSAEETAEASEQTKSTIHIVAAGDLNITDEIVLDAMGALGYDFTQAFLDVAPVLGGGDLTIVNFEGTLAGAPYGTETGSAPQPMAQALADMGVDVVQTANSAAIRSGVLGLQSTISGFESVGIRTVGTFRDSDDFRKSGGYTVVEVEGFRIALVAFTKGMDNLGLPEGSEDCVNLLYKDYTTTYKSVDTDGITRVLRNVQEAQPDLTIALLHWGSEYNEEISSSQKKIRDLMLSNGVDVILGTHSHLLQAVEFQEDEGTLVAWSLGDFYGNATEAGTNYSVILDLEVSRDELTGQVRVTGYDTVPIYTLKPGDSKKGGQRVVRLQAAMERYDSDYFGTVNGDVYASMEYALNRIGERLAGE